jgi:hypothetical protein
MKLVSDKSIEPELEKHKVDDVVTVNKKQSDYNNFKDLKKKRIIINSNQKLCDYNFPVYMLT